MTVKIAILPALLCITAIAAWCAPARVVNAPDGSEKAIAGENVPITGDSLTLYTPAWGETTPDNPWARSVVVIGGNVTQVVARGIATIPADGFVLTGHGEGGSWLAAHLPEGAEVSIQDAAPFAEEIAERDVHSVDPTDTTFPSGRGTNQLVVYTRAVGERTGTNIFGSECIVREGRIVERTGGDSLIPEDGFVLSGHGGGSGWIMKHCPVGARVELTGTHIGVTRDRDAYLLQADADIRQAEKRIAWATEKQIACPLESANSALAEAKDHLARARELIDAEPREAAQALSAARRSAWTACARASETRKVEARGAWMWHRHTLGDRDRRRAFFSRLRDANITMILPLISSLLGGPEDEQLMRDAIADAHEFGIEVHPWTWLPVHSIPRSKDAERIKEHEDWADVDSSGKALGNLDLANAEVRAALVQDAVWLATNFDIDGLHMDWEGTSGGYSEISRKGFAAANGYDPLSEEGPAGPERARDLYLWRTGLVDQVVTEVVAAFRERGCKALVSSAVQCFDFHPNAPGDTVISGQWMRWVARGQLDIACPMIYAQNVEFVSETAEAMHREIGGRALHYGGLITYPETAQCGLVEPHQLLEQIDAVRAAGCEGIILFPAEYLFVDPWTPDDRLLLTLQEGPFRERAELPHKTRAQAPLTPDATVPCLYAVAEPGDVPAQVGPGQTVRASVKVSNWGTEAFAIQGVEVRTPDAWAAGLDTPVQVAPGAEVLVPISLTAPANLTAGDVRLDVHVLLETPLTEKSLAVGAFALKAVVTQP